jgi:hypothetical protein
MPKALAEIAKEAMELPSRQRVALAGLLLKSADEMSDADAEIAWEVEIRERIATIEEGRVTGIPYDEVMREADRRLKR